jgi:hypothetical protein
LLLMFGEMPCAGSDGVAHKSVPGAVEGFDAGRDAARQSDAQAGEAGTEMFPEQIGKYRRSRTHGRTCRNEAVSEAVNSLYWKYRLQCSAKPDKRA